MEAVLVNIIVEAKECVLKEDSSHTILVFAKETTRHGDQSYYEIF